MRTLTTSDEDGTNIHQGKQPGRETGKYSIPKTCPKVVGERPASYLQATNHPCRCYFAHLQALRTFL
eukprot:9291636-Ditylum_brightwellii.AAC.1